MTIQLKATILIVDSRADQLALTTSLLQDQYNVVHAHDGQAAVRMASQAPRPDLIVLAEPDGPDSFSVLHELKYNFLSAELPVIVLLPPASAALEQRAMEEGAADVVSVPLSPATLHARVAAHVQLKQARALLEVQHSRSEYALNERSGDAARIQDAAVMAMALLAEPGDSGTAHHIRRTQHYVAALARELRFHPSFQEVLSNEIIALLFQAAPLHDIGKAGIPEAILHKPGKLTSAEFDIMKQHTVFGRDAIASVEKVLGASTPFLGYARDIIYSHQEKWDGSGYPQGLAGSAIPLAARLMAVADVYDALITARPYRPAFTHETAVELIRQGSGEHFDPDVVDAMLIIADKFKVIAAEFPGQ